MVARVNSMGIFGMQSFMVAVEADLSGTKYKFDLVGLPDTAVNEARERVIAAVRNSGYQFPYIHITVNLAPADVRKEGSVYDLPILIAILLGGRQLNVDLSDCAFIGELSLAGEVRQVNGVLPMVIEAMHAGVKRVFVPAENAAEASPVRGVEVYGVKNLRQLLAFLTGGEAPEDAPPLAPTPPFEFRQGVLPEWQPDFADVRGQQTAKRALEVAAAGGHNLLMVGPPGSGKSMLAKRLPSILPDLTFAEALEISKIYSVAGLLGRENGLVTVRPFRSPHHTVSTVALSGGGTVPHPGEISLAHHGVLFLDELPEFSRPSMETLRQPLEDGRVTISRVAGTLTYPCELMLVAAMNPCPCGYLGHPTKKCTCPPGAAQRYLSRVSGPLMDRIDIQIEVPPVDFAALTDTGKGESSAEIKARVNAARRIQEDRFINSMTVCNAKMTAAEVQTFCAPTDRAKALLRQAFDKLGLSARAYDKLLKVARTVADLAGDETVDEPHVLEAIRYRNLDRRIFG